MAEETDSGIPNGEDIRRAVEESQRQHGDFNEGKTDDDAWILSDNMLFIFIFRQITQVHIFCSSRIYVFV